MRERVQWFADQLSIKSRDIDGHYDNEEDFDTHWLISTMRDVMTRIWSTSPSDYDDMIDECAELAYFTMLVANRVKEDRYKNEWEELHNG